MPVTVNEPTTLEKRRRLPWSLAVDAGNTVFLDLTFFGSVFALFLSALGLSKSAMGLLFSFLPFAAAAAPLIAPQVARLGYKRTYLAFYSARSLVAATLLLTPWVMSHYGDQAALFYVSAVVALFALLRAVGMTALEPWSQEYVPSQIRGRYAAVDSAVQGAADLVAILGATYILSQIAGLWGFMLLIGVGVLFGLAAVGAGVFVPGGAPDEATATTDRVKRDLRQALCDRDYLYFLASMALVLLGIMPIISFLPLYMREQVGLSDSQVVLLQAGILAGGLLTAYLWGWSADRFGSKPVMLTGLGLRLLLPVGWLLMPRHTLWSFSAALGIAFLQGVGTFGWIAGATRLRHVNLVPPENRNGYMALFLAWTGLVDGMSRLLGGWLLDRAQGLHGMFGPLPLDPYLPLLLMSIGFPLLSFLLLTRIQTQNNLSMGHFVQMFLRGKPVLALRALIGFYRAKDETTAASMTEQLGEAKSPLAIDELITALADPRFQVRFEAIIAIAHMEPDERLSEALIDILQGNDPVFGGVAAWALSRLGDRHALKPLRACLDSPYAPLRAYSARSLGVLVDHSAAPILLERLCQEEDHDLQVAYASALGQMRVVDAAPHILELLRRSEEPLDRRELALALARIVGEEHRYIQLMREAEEDSCTATAQAVLMAKKHIGFLLSESHELLTAVDECAETLARNELAGGVSQICAIIHQFPPEVLDPIRITILHGCAECLNEQGHQSIEFLLLALHALHFDMAPVGSSYAAAANGTPA